MIRDLIVIIFFTFLVIGNANGASLIMSGDQYASAQNKARILIVPGHEPNYGGAEFGPVIERDLVAELGQDLRDFLEADNNYQVFITRNGRAWDSVFAGYFKNNWDAIKTWEQASRQNGTRIKAREASTSPIIEHVKVPPNVALRLYGINKWANENSIDLVIHLHLNDAPDRSWWAPGKYSGVVIYTPADKYANSSTTAGVANAVLKRLSQYGPMSNLPGESDGIVADPELIAVGANNTSEAASLLIEYNYIYEPQFADPRLRSLALRDLAYQTYLGLRDFFEAGSATSTPVYDPSSIYVWRTPVSGNYSDPKDIYSLQTALMMAGYYPPAGKTKNDCPHTGVLGSCTQVALRKFQEHNAIADETIDGPNTFYLLSRIYARGK